MEESRTNYIDILDLESQGFKEMMGFIYMRNAPDLHNMAVAVLAAGNKYGLECLKVMCQDALFRDLSMENAAHIFILVTINLSAKSHPSPIATCVLYANSSPELGPKLMHRETCIRFKSCLAND